MVDVDADVVAKRRTEGKLEVVRKIARTKP